jgi:hypothetical protein
MCLASWEIVVERSSRSDAATGGAIMIPYWLSCLCRRAEDMRLPELEFNLDASCVMPRFVSKHAARGHRSSRE